MRLLTNFRHSFFIKIQRGRRGSCLRSLTVSCSTMEKKYMVKQAQNSDTSLINSIIIITLSDEALGLWCTHQGDIHRDSGLPHALDHVLSTGGRTIP